MNYVAIPDNVWAMLHKAADDVGQISAVNFSQEMHSDIFDQKIESPIEQIFLVAFNVMCRAYSITMRPQWNVAEDDTFAVLGGMSIKPQHQIGKYRVDFHITSFPWRKDRSSQEVIVELDGHAFHDKDKKQRSYEKARDRYFVRHGHRVLHFTGSDVVSDPYAVAHEVLDALDLVYGETYDASNPFGIA